MKIDLEQHKTGVAIPDKVLSLYRVYGYEEVAYKAYLKSKKVFEAGVASSRITPKDKNLLEQTKDGIAISLKNGDVTPIVDALKSNDIEIQRLGASLVENASMEQQTSLREIIFQRIIDGLNNQNIQVQRIAINMIQYAPTEKRDQLREIVLQKILEVFNSTDVNSQRIMAKKIKEAPAHEQDRLRELVYTKIIEALNNQDVKVQRLAAVMVQYAPVDKQKELKELVCSKFELVKQQHRFNEIVESLLYLGAQEHPKSAFSRENFPKTGSETTLLLGKQFKNNLITRHIEEPCFSVWRKAYEGYEVWENAGFDYVPIEPIYSFNYISKDGFMNVSSGVLDLNLEEWYAFSGGSFKQELDEQKTKIIQTLMNLNIDHGHPNNANFCLRFYRDDNGDVDINRVPRIYLIDFDKATTLEK